MYKYVKGNTVISNERMPNAMEIAENYGLWIPLDGTLVPNGTLIDFIIKAYLEQHNIKSSEYYYIEPFESSFQVFPEQLATQIMEEFIKFLEDNNIEKDKNKVYQYNTISFVYYEPPEDPNKIISYEKFLEYKEKRND